MRKLNKMYNYNTLSEAVNDLQKRGYTHDFLIPKDKECIHCLARSLELSPEELYLMKFIVLKKCRIQMMNVFCLLFPPLRCTR